MPSKKEIEIYNELTELGQKKDFAGLVQFSMENAFSNYQVIEDFFTDYFDRDNDPDLENYIGIRIELSRRQAEFRFAKLNEMEDAEQKILNGEIPEAVLIKDDPKAVSTLAAAIALNSDPAKSPFAALQQIDRTVEILNNVNEEDSVMVYEATSKETKKYWDEREGYTPEQRKKVIKELNGHLNDGITEDIRWVAVSEDTEFSFTPVKVNEDLLGCKTHEDVDELEKKYNEKLNSDLNDEAKQIYRKGIGLIDKAHDLIEMRAMPEYKELVDRRTDLRNLNNAKKTLSPDDFADFSREMKQAQDALREADEWFKQDKAGRKEGDMSDSYKMICESLDKFVNMDIEKTNPKKAYDALADVIRDAGSYHSKHTGFTNMFKGNSLEGKQRVSWSDIVNKTAKPFCEKTEKLAAKLGSKFSKDWTLANINQAVMTDRVSSQAEAEIADLEKYVNDELTARRAHRTAQKEAKKLAAENADKPVDLDQKIKSAQDFLKAEYDIAEKNAGYEPGEEPKKEFIPNKLEPKNSTAYAQIVAGHHLNSQKNKAVSLGHPAPVVTEKDFADMTDTVLRSKDFKRMMNENRADDLYKHSQRGNAADIMGDYTRAHNNRKKEEQDILNNIDQPELQRDKSLDNNKQKNVF